MLKKVFPGLAGTTKAAHFILDKVHVQFDHSANTATLTADEDSPYKGLLTNWFTGQCAAAKCPYAAGMYLITYNHNGSIVISDSEYTIRSLTGPLSEREKEMMHNIRAMAKALNDIADIWDANVKNFPEPSAAARAAADWKHYLEQYGITE